MSNVTTEEIQIVSKVLEQSIKGYNSKTAKELLLLAVYITKDIHITISLKVSSIYMTYGMICRLPMIHYDFV
jgi:hypothetical protein